MANINIKTNFVDGEKLFAQQLNNNFKTIQEGMNADNKIIWQDGEEVLFKRYVTNDIESLPILDGSIIYDVEKGRHYIDYNGNRIQVGSAGKEVLVQDNEPIEEDNKIWIDTDFVNTMGTEVVDSLDGDETNMAPSVRVVKERINTAIKDVYSEEEQVIGTWKDGKLLYRKVISVSSIDCSKAGFKYVEHGISNLKNVINCVYHFYASDISSAYTNFTFNGAITSLSYNDSNIRFYTDDWEVVNDWSFIIEYTKTTDSEVISNEV